MTTIAAADSAIANSAVPDSVVAYLLTLMTPLELLRIAEMEECERLSSLNAKTLEREHGDKIIPLSKRRKGMRVVHALMLREPDTS